VQNGDGRGLTFTAQGNNMAMRLDTLLNNKELSSRLGKENSYA